VDIFQVFSPEFVYNVSMPKKKKSVFDNRDALEILRDAFWDSKPAQIAELKTRSLKTRTVAQDLYREPIPEMPNGVSKKIRTEGKEPTFKEDWLEESKPFWEEQSEPNREEEPIPPATEKTPPVSELAPKPEPITGIPLQEKLQTKFPKTKPALVHELRNETARKAIDIGLVDKINARIENIENKELSPNERAQLEQIREKYEKKIKETEPNVPKREKQNGIGTEEDIKKYAEELAAQAQVEITQKLPKKEDLLAHWENEGGAILQEKTEPISAEAPIPPASPIEKLETESTSLDQLEVEEGAQRLKELMTNRSTTQSKITGIEMWAVNMKTRAKNDEIKSHIEKIEKRAKELVGSTPTETTPPPPPPEASKSKPAGRIPEDKARAEQAIESLAQQEAEHYKYDVAKMEEHARELASKKLPSGEVDTIAIKRMERAIEIAKARAAATPIETTPAKKDKKTEQKLSPEPVPDLTPPTSLETAPTPAPAKKTQEEISEEAWAYYATKERERQQTESAKKEEERIEEGKKFAANLHPEKEARALNPEDVPKEKQEYHAGDTAVWHTQGPAGSQAFEVSVQGTMPDGSVVIDRPDGKEEIVHPDNLTKLTSVEELPKTVVESRETRMKSFEEKTAALEKTINETGGTREQKNEHAARQEAQRFNHDPDAIEKEANKLRKSKNVVEKIFKIQALEKAQKLVEAELGEKRTEPSPDKKTSNTPEAAKESIPTEADKAFAEFGFSAEEFRNLDPESYNKLSVGQKRLLLHNLNQVVLGRIQTEATAAFRDARKEDSQKTSFMGKVAHGFLRMVNPKKWESYQAANIEKKTADDVRHDTANHKILLTAMMRGLADHGPEVVELPDGTLDVRYIRVEDIAPLASTLSQKEQGKLFKIVDAYNAHAHTLENTPIAWSRREASRKEQRASKKAAAAYQRAERSLILAMSRQGTPEEIAQRMFQISEARGTVRMNQMMNSHPDATNELQRIVSQDTMWRAVKNLFRQTTTKERIAVFAGGIGVLIQNFFGVGDVQEIEDGGGGGRLPFTL